MSEKEAQNKSSLWYKVNEKYLEEQKGLFDFVSKMKHFLNILIKVID